MDRTQNNFLSLSLPIHHTPHPSQIRQLTIPPTHFEHLSFLVLLFYLGRRPPAHTSTCHTLVVDIDPPPIKRWGLWPLPLNLGWS